MTSLIVLTLVVPLIGAVGILVLSLVPRLRPYARYIALAAVCLTVVLLLSLRRAGPVEDDPFSWQPSLLLGVTPLLQSNSLVQPLALALTLMACSMVLVELGRAGTLPPRLLAVSLALLVAGLVSLWAATPLTMIIGWAVYDLLQAVGCIAAGGSVRAAMRGLIFGSLATLLLWGGTLLSVGEGGSALWSLMSPQAGSLTLWTVAAMLRLWVYPFHLAVPDGLDTASSLVSFLQSPVIGWGLMLRLVLLNDGAIPGGGWMLTLAALTLAVGSFLAWACQYPRATLPWIGMGSTGAVLLAAGLAGDSAAGVIAAGGVAWALGVTVLFLYDGLRRESPWWSVPALVGALALLGIPPTLGFVSQAALLGGLAREARLGLGGAVFFGNLFLVPALVRWLLVPSSSPSAPRRWLLLARGIGLGLPASLLVVAGFYPQALIGGASLSVGSLFVIPSLAGWLLWVVSLAGGGVLAWQERNVRPQAEFLFGAAYDLLRLVWLYGAVARALDRGLSVLHVADEVVGGAGALLWSWVLFLLILLVWGSL
jgi:multicomponent Na+:H+ antiporter subunit D